MQEITISAVPPLQLMWQVINQSRWAPSLKLVPFFFVNLQPGLKTMVAKSQYLLNACINFNGSLLETASSRHLTTSPPLYIIKLLKHCTDWAVWLASHLRTKVFWKTHGLLEPAVSLTLVTSVFCGYVWQAQSSITHKRRRRLDLRC